MMRVLLLVAALLAAVPVQATRLPHIFGDHMVLQAGKPVPVWGRGAPGERVTIAFAGRRVIATADARGEWRATLAPLAATDRAQEFIVTGHDTIRFTDVLVGEVWIASGQSNMEKPIGDQPGQKPTFDAAQEIAAADHPTLRLFKVKRAAAKTPQDDVDGEWVVTTPASVDATHFSAAGYFFGRALMRALDRPVGMIDATWGGTRIEPWTPPAALLATDRGDAEAATIWNGTVAPLAPYAMAGAIWYQGESSVMAGDTAAQYLARQRALVAGWRTAFGDPFAFYLVQIAPWRYFENGDMQPVTRDAAAELRGAQAEAARTIPASGLVVTSDLVDDLADIHPREKRAVGLRLANLALAGVYGRQVSTHGPEVGDARVSGDTVTVRFDHAAGLRTRDGKAPSGFLLAGADGVFYRAGRAVIVGDTVALSSPRVAGPRTVSMGWTDTMAVNLTNADGLPAVAFRRPLP